MSTDEARRGDLIRGEGAAVPGSQARGSGIGVRTEHPSMDQPGHRGTENSELGHEIPTPPFPGIFTHQGPVIWPSREEVPTVGLAVVHSLDTQSSSSRLGLGLG